MAPYGTESSSHGDVCPGAEKRIAHAVHHYGDSGLREQLWQCFGSSGLDSHLRTHAANPGITRTCHSMRRYSLSWPWLARSTASDEFHGETSSRVSRLQRLTWAAKSSTGVLSPRGGRLFAGGAVALNSAQRARWSSPALRRGPRFAQRRAVSRAHPLPSAIPHSLLPPAYSLSPNSTDPRSQTSPCSRSAPSPHPLPETPSSPSP